MAVPNPFVVGSGRVFLAFNLADVCAFVGIFALVSALGAWLISNRDQIPPPAEMRATRGRAIRRLFDDER